MIDKKKLTLIITIGAVLLAALIAAAIWIIVLLSSDQTAAPAAPTETSTAQPTETPAELTPEISSAAITAAATAAQFQGSDTQDQRERNYITAGFIPELAANFVPVWFDVFDTPAVGKVTIESTGETLLSAAVSVQAHDATVVKVTGSTGNRVFTIDVDVDCRPQWTTENGNPQTTYTFTNTWRITVDEATEQITAIEQPTVDEIPFTPEG